MIPKTIHYCWFGNNEKPDIFYKCFCSWKALCPNFEIIEWNERNFDINCNKFCKEAYENKQWAFVADYARLKIIYEQGGVYLDTDVELIKPIEQLIKDGIGYLGYQNKVEVNTGLGFAAEQYNEIIKAMMDIYERFDYSCCRNGSRIIPCPVLNTAALNKMGIKNVKIKDEIQYTHRLRLYPQEYFNPMDKDKRSIRLTNNTYSIHHYSGSWCEKNKMYSIIKRITPLPILRLRQELVAKRNIAQILYISK